MLHNVFDHFIEMFFFFLWQKVSDFSDDMFECLSLMQFEDELETKTQHSVYFKSAQRETSLFADDLFPLHAITPISLMLLEKHLHELDTSLRNWAVGRRADMKITVASNETVVWHLLDDYPSQRAGSLFCGDLRGFFFFLVKVFFFVFFFPVFPFLDQWSKGRWCCTYRECKARSLANLGCTSKISLTDWLIREIFLSESSNQTFPAVLSFPLRRWNHFTFEPAT